MGVLGEADRPAAGPPVPLPTAMTSTPASRGGDGTSERAKESIACSRTVKHPRQHQRHENVREREASVEVNHEPAHRHEAVEPACRSRNPGQRTGPVLGILGRDHRPEADADRDEAIVVGWNGGHVATASPTSSGLGTVARRSPRIRAPSSRTIHPASACCAGSSPSNASEARASSSSCVPRCQVVVNGGHESARRSGRRLQR